MIPDLSLGKRLTAILLLLAVPVVLAAILVLSVSVYKKTNQLPGDSEQIKKVLDLLKLADSIRDSSPDSALADYNKAILMLQNSTKGKEKLYHLSNGYCGIAYINSGRGEYILASENDSLAMKIASASNDKSTIEKVLIIRGVNLYRQGEYSKAMDCYMKSLDLAMQTKDLELQAKILANRAMIYYDEGDYTRTIEGFAHALRIGKQLNNMPLIAENYKNLSVVYINQSINDSALIYSNLSLELFRKMNDKNGQIKCFRNLGNIYYGLSDFGKAIEFYRLSLQLALEMNDKLNAAKAYHNLSEIYIHLDDNTTATNLLFKSIKIKEQLNDKLSLAKGYMGLARLYYAQKEYPRALTYFRKALQINLKLKRISEIGGNYSGIASVYSSIHMTDSAIVLYKKALELYKQVDYTYGISNTYINLGDEYRVKKDFHQAERILIKALQSKKETKEEEGVAIVNNMLASLYLTKANDQVERTSTNLLTKAEMAGLESFKIAKRLGALPVMKDASHILKEIYQKEGKYRESLLYSETFNSLSDSLLNKAKVEALTFAEARWNVEKKQQEISRLENAGKLQQAILMRKEAETARQKLIIWFIISFFLLSAIAVLIISMYIRKRRDAIYHKQLANITALRMQNVRNTMSPHFFFNVLASLSGFSHQPEQLKEKLNSLSLLLRKMIENIDRTAIPLNEELAAVKAYIELFQVKMPEPILIEYCIKEGTNMQGLIPAMMIQIPVENAIKHGLMPLEGEKKLSISIMDFERHQQITVTDNGIGLKASAGCSTGTGTGLKVLLQTIHLLNAGNPHISSTGTSVNIEIPFNFNYSL